MWVRVIFGGILIALQRRSFLCNAECHSVHVRIGGYGRPSFTEFTVAGKNLTMDQRKRLNIIVVNPETQEIVDKNSWLAESDSHKLRLIRYMVAIPMGSVVAVGAPFNAAMESQELASEMRSIGASITYSSGYVLIGIKGAAALAEKEGLNVEASSVIPCKTKVKELHGGTAVAVASGGTNDIRIAVIALAGHHVDVGETGLNVVAVDPTSKQVLKSEAYNLLDDPEKANRRLAKDMKALPDGTLVMAGMNGEGLEELSDDSIKLLQDCGAKLTVGRPGIGYALIGTKGGKLIAEELNWHAEIHAVLPGPTPKPPVALAPHAVTTSTTEEPKPKKRESSGMSTTPEPPAAPAPHPVTTPTEEEPKLRKKEDSGTSGSLGEFGGTGVLVIVLLVLGLLAVLCLGALLVFLLCPGDTRPKRSEYEPLEEHNAVREQIEQATENKVEFIHQDSRLKPKGKLAVEKVSIVLREHPEVSLTVEGFTGHPPLGKWKTYQDVKVLGFLRALEIKNALKEHGCTNRIAIIGRGAQVGKGANCEIHLCTPEEADRIDQEAKDMGQIEGFAPPI